MALPLLKKKKTLFKIYGHYRGGIVAFSGLSECVCVGGGGGGRTMT